MDAKIEGTEIPGEPADLVAKAHALRDLVDGEAAAGEAEGKLTAKTDGC
jgi:hypothetical protein